MHSVLLHPSYFPSIAHMAAVAQADRVVFEMHDNYQKQTYRNRAYIAHAQGKLLLNVPVKHSQTPQRQKTSTIKLETNFDWQSQHLKSLQTAYRTSPFFEFYEDELLELFTRAVTHLTEHNLYVFDILCELIGLSVTVDFSTEYELSPNITDGRELIKARKGITFDFEPYTHVFIEKHGFISNLSILDLLFNLGPETMSYLERQKVF